MKKLIFEDRELYKKIDHRVRNVELAINATNTEFREVQVNHNNLSIEVDHIKHFLGLSGDVASDLQKTSNRTDEDYKEMQHELEQETIMQNTSKHVDFHQQIIELENENINLKERLNKG